MPRLCAAIDMFPLGEEAEDGYSVLCVDVWGKYHHVEFENFDEAYSFKNFLNDLDVGNYFEVEDVTEIFKE